MTRSHQPAPARLTIRQERRAWRLPAFHHLARRAVSPSPASLVRPPRGIGPGNSRAHPRPNPAKANSCVNQQFSGCVFHAARCCRGAGPAGRRSGRRPQRRAGMRLAGLNPARGRGNTPQPPPAPRAGRCGPAIPAPACAFRHGPRFIPPTTHGEPAARPYVFGVRRRPVQGSRAADAVGSQVLTPVHALTYGRTSPLPCPAAVERLR